MKTYADAKQRAKTTKLKAWNDVLAKHTGTKDKLTSYWTNDLFTVTKVNGPTIIVRRKRDVKVFTKNISMVKKYKHISDSDDHSVIDSSGSAEMDTENPHPDNRGSYTDSVENVGTANNVRLSSCTRNPPIRSLDRLCIYELCIWTLYMTFVYTMPLCWINRRDLVW